MQDPDSTAEGFRDLLIEISVSVHCKYAASSALPVPILIDLG